MKVIPAIIPQSRGQLLSGLAPVRGIAAGVQVDLVDGIYAGKPAWPWNLNDSPWELFAALKTLSADFALEIDLMVQNPETLVEGLIKAGAKRLVIHVGSTKKLDAILMHRNLVKIGLAFKNGTSLSVLATHGQNIDFVQCMGIAEIGVQGSRFDERVIPRIKEIHARYPSLEIGVDGHVTATTLPLLKQAGATRFVSGSAILGAENPHEAYLLLQKLAEVA